ncbi:MAG: ATP-binding protein [Gammaproteobacteria bacterium]|nr:ATP-binding protein [Gammaproteobacteria bacterium]
MFPDRFSDRPAFAVGSLSALNLQRLLLLRAGAVLGWVLALLFVGWQLGISLPFITMSALIAVWCIVSLASWAWLRDREDISDRVFVVQLLLDVAMLGLLLYLSGGSTNPLALLLLLPLIVSAALLPGVYSWIIAVAIIACYTLLLFRYEPLPIPAHEHGLHDFELHVTGMWLGFVLSAGLIVAFVAKMGSTLRERDRLLSESKQRALRDERIVALGALAAGAAHELGTPLGTIALIAEELGIDHEDDESLQQRLGLLREQVGRCKRTLTMLSLSAGQSQAASGHCLPVDEYLWEVIERWRALRPATEVRTDLAGDRPAPVIVAEQTLSQAIISILNNAADASRERIELKARWDWERLTLEVCDHGAGLAPAALSAAGKRVFSTKAPGEGLGLGLYLAYSVVDRLGGEMLLFNREEGGACTWMTLPLTQLLVRDDNDGPEGGEGGSETAAGR